MIKKWSGKWVVVRDYKNKKMQYFFCNNNYSKKRTYTVLNTLPVDCNFKISGLRCMKLQHTNDPDKLGPELQHTNDAFKLGPDKHRVISSCFLIWWKDLFCSIIKWLPFKKKERQKTKTNLLCKLLWMGLWNNENSARSYFQVLQLSGRTAKWHPCTGAKWRERWNFRGLV